MCGEPLIIKSFCSDKHLYRQYQGIHALIFEYKDNTLDMIIFGTQCFTTDMFVRITV